MRIQIVDTPSPLPIPEIATRFVSEALLPSVTQSDVNKPIAVLLGGSHAKQLSNSRSDVDLTLYYTTTVNNLLSFRRETLNIVPNGRFKQVELESRSSVFYEWEGTKFEVAVEPVRRVGSGSDLLGSLHGNNMKTLHDLLYQYVVWQDEQYWQPVMDTILHPEFDWSVDSAMGYFSGYLKSQLMDHRRLKDFAQRERQAIEQNNVNPTVKAVVSGMYIGLSGLFLLDEASVSHDFWKLWQRYEKHFTNEQAYFIEKCWKHKTDRQRIVDNVSHFVFGAAKHREAMYVTMSALFDQSKEFALKSGRFNESVNRKRNGELLDVLQKKILVGNW